MCKPMVAYSLTSARHYTQFNEHSLHEEVGLYIHASYAPYTGQDKFVPYLARMGHAVAQLVKALRHKSEGRGSRWCNWNILLP